MTIGSGPNSTPPVKRSRRDTGYETKYKNKSKWKTKIWDSVIKRTTNLEKNTILLQGRMGLIRKTTMKIKNGIRSVSEVVRRFPGAFRRVVAHPIDEVLQLASSDAGIEDRIYLVLREPVHLDG